MERIGHLALEPDCYLKEEALGLHPRFKAFVCAPIDKVANRHLLSYWRPYLRFITSPVVCWLLKPIACQAVVQYDVYQYGTAMEETATCGALQAKWGERKPLLDLTAFDERRGRNCLRAMGIPDDAWFVCVHNREGGYSPSDEHLHSFRNSSITSYLEALDAITSRGGWCIRMGDPSMTRLPMLRRVVDYAHHPLRSDWLDIYLCARCKFFLGSASGLPILANIFGVPFALANIAPLSAVLPLGPKDLGVPKLLRATATNRVLTFGEILDSPLAIARLTSQYEEAGVEVLDNTPDEIMALALEMLDNITCGPQYTEEDESLQRRFKCLLKPGHYCYRCESRVGRHFLSKYSHLLPTEVPRER